VSLNCLQLALLDKLPDHVYIYKEEQRLMNQDGGNHNMDGLIGVKATDKQGSR